MEREEASAVDQCMFLDRAVRECDFCKQELKEMRLLKTWFSGGKKSFEAGRTSAKALWWENV